MITDLLTATDAINAITMAKGLIHQTLTENSSTLFPKEHDVLKAFLEDKATLGEAIQALHAIIGT